MKAFLAKIFAKRIVNKEQKWIENPLEAQDKILKELVAFAKNTKFGKDHHFDEINTYQEFKNLVPVNDYEGLKHYFDEVVTGKSDILWPGKPIYLAKTSGTTSGAKYIPLTKESIPYHINSARNALLYYIHEKQNADFVNGKMIFLQGSPILEEQNGLKVGRLSGISAHFVPNYLQKNRLPSHETNIIEDWETKVDRVVAETVNADMTLISGIPPWLIMYFERLIKISGKENVQSIFKNLQLMVTGGVNYEPYREKVNQLIGRKIDCIQTYPASEGFIAYQNSQQSEDLLLLLNNGMFYEFIPVDEFFDEKPTRISIKDVELGKDYVLILNTNAGLWGYNIGDTVRFTSLKPFKIVVSGRIKHYTSAFGEHVIGHEVEQALQKTIEKFPASVNEFSVAPQVNPAEGLPYHEWLIEFDQKPQNIAEFNKELDVQMRKQNTYYDDLITGNILTQLQISIVEKDGFQCYMKSIGKLGGQNKVPRLSNNRDIADEFYTLNLINKQQ
ncbi:GH3 auxin-responsive promoter [Algoriella xinjiangensis]|uniref:GH3 auxin-responsive promoter n=1 Tax=Algoriella xinjiangensis TaxID=684065 RepID=A0A1I4WAP6_9FLAO|nr:GH3 auxin-responsive promoter family protein [Algoriella xinjiangensis]SFN10453.1 GH3 auxin-responsive promoter [Algoriella xinjiangensis]VDH15419.1 GH3 auxin-responsive promoter [Algoriella xinjiangensis]